MNKIKKIIYILLTVALFHTNLIARLKYPAPKKVIQTDDYIGTKVEAPYRWLKNDNSDETRANRKADRRSRRYPELCDV